MTSAHGHLKSVRLPKKFDARTRGFAFLLCIPPRSRERVCCSQAQPFARPTLGVGVGRGSGTGFGRAADEGGRWIWRMPGRNRKLDLGKTGKEDVEDLEV